MSYPNMNPGNPNDPSQPPQPGYGAYAPSQQAQQSQQQDGPQSGGPDAEQTPRYSGNPYGNSYGNPYGYPYGNPYGYDPNSHSNDSGEWEPVSPFKLVESWLPQRAKNAIRGVYGVLGVMAIVLGIALLIWPGVTLKIAAVALGAYFVISGVIRIVTAIVELGLPGGWRVLDILVGLLLTVGGVVMLKNATLSGAMLAVLVTMVVGLGWMMEGVMALVESWHMPSSAWAVIYALISIVAGCIMLFSPLASTGWLILFGGCALVALGIVAIVRAFTFGKVGKSGKKR